jgi:transposase
MGKYKRMDQIRTILTTYQATQSIKKTARQLKTSKNTVREYLRRSQAHSPDLASVLSLDEGIFEQIMYPEDSPKETERAAYFSSRSGYWIGELRRVGVTRQLLWEEYRQECPEGYGYSQFCERLRLEIARRDLTLSLNHEPGKTMMVDFAGKKLHWVDRYSGEVIECEVLVAVLPHSQYTFAIALPSQKIGDFVHGLNQALLFFGGLPKVILSDNLKSYVTRSDRYEPVFSQLCEQLGTHYQVDLEAARVVKPRDKASVENAVGIAYFRIYAPLRHETFHSLAEVNTGILKQLGQHNSKPYQKKAGSRQQVFQDFELPQMRPLPSELFEIKKTVRAKIQRNYHVFLGEEKNYYSVPWQYAGQQTEVVYTSTVVEAYLKGRRIATHRRLPGWGTHFYQTEKTHMPRRHQEWEKAQDHDAAHFLTQAEKIGPVTQWAIQAVLLSRIHEEQSYNSCRGILRLGSRYGPDRLEKACERCRKAGRANYTMLQRILSLKLDQVEEAPKALNPGTHENIRGAGAYQ